MYLVSSIDGFLGLVAYIGRNLIKGANTILTRLWLNIIKKY